MKNQSKVSFTLLPQIAFVSGLVALALVDAGCGHATEAKAKKIPILVKPENQLREYVPQDITFPESQLFLWKKDFTPEQVAEVLEKSAEYDKAKGDLFSKGKARQALREKFAAIGVDAVDLESQLPELADKQAALAEIVKQLESENRKPEAERDAKLLAKLARDQGRIQRQIQPTLDAKALVKKAGFEKEFENWLKIEKALENRRGDSQAYLNAIDERVWLYKSDPITFEFKFPADSAAHPEKIAAEIHNWEIERTNDPELSLVPHARSKNFSTADHSIGHVAYETEGGVFAFEVYSPAATFYFKIARLNYGVDDGRVHYKGDIVRCSVEPPVPARDPSGVPIRVGKPLIQYVRDFVQCGVQDGDGTPVLRRGAASLADQDIKD